MECNLDVRSFPGETLDARILAALETASGPVLLDACNFTSDQTFASWPFAKFSYPIHFVTCGYTLSWDPEKFIAAIPSDFQWELKNTTLRNSVPGGGGFSGTDPGLLNTRRTGVLGSIEAGSNQLRLESEVPIRVGTVVGIPGAEGGNPNQFTKLTLGVDAQTNQLPVQSIAGWATSANNLLLLESELVSCNAAVQTAFVNCSRAVLGTMASSHPAGASVQAVGYMIATVTRISGLYIELDRPASFSVALAHVAVGSSNIRIYGTGTIDGNQLRSSPDPRVNLVGFHGSLLSDSAVGEGITFRNIDHAGILCQGCANNQFFGRFSCIGRPADGLGFDVILFGKNWLNTVRTESHTYGNFGFALDDRTNNFNLYDGPATQNVAYLGPMRSSTIPSPRYGVVVDGAVNNHIEATQIEARGGAILVGSMQWTLLTRSTDNSITADYTSGAITIDNTATNGSNTVNVRNAQGSVSCSSGNSCWYGVGIAQQVLPDAPPESDICK